MANTIQRNPSLDPKLQARISGYDSLSDDKKKELKKLEGTTKEFESIFVYQMLKEMRKTVHKTGLTGGGMAEDVFADMLDQERTKGVGIGMGEMLFIQLSKAIVPTPRKR